VQLPSCCINLHRVQHSLVQMKDATCADEGWNTVQCSFVMQLVQMRGGTQYNDHMLCNLCRWGVEHSTMFICYANEVECANEGWKTVQYFATCANEVEVELEQM